MFNILIFRYLPAERQINDSVTFWSLMDWFNLLEFSISSSRSRLILNTATYKNI